MNDTLAAHMLLLARRGTPALPSDLAVARPAGVPCCSIRTAVLLAYVMYGRSEWAPPQAFKGQ
jgi:hypothetical protein